MPAEGFTYRHVAVQRRERNRGGWEDNLLIIFKLFKVTATRRRITDPHTYESNILAAERDWWVSFSHFKHQLISSSSNPNHEYEQRISETLSSMGVPEDEHPAIIEKVFRVVEAAETTQLPVLVGVWDIYSRYDGDDVGDDEGYRPNFTRASTSSIQGLESLLEIQDHVIPQTPSCAICLEDFRAAGAGGVVEQQPSITRLPCGHHYHLHCIVQCLEINHLCPLCRYPMPTEDHSN